MFTKFLNIVAILSISIGMLSVESDSIWYSVVFILIACVAYRLSDTIETKEKKECSGAEA